MDYGLTQESHDLFEDNYLNPADIQLSHSDNDVTLPRPAENNYSLFSFNEEAESQYGATQFGNTGGGTSDSPSGHSDDFGNNQEIDDERDDGELVSMDAAAGGIFNNDEDNVNTQPDVDGEGVSETRDSGKHDDERKKERRKKKKKSREKDKKHRSGKHKSDSNRKRHKEDSRSRNDGEKESKSKHKRIRTNDDGGGDSNQRRMVNDDPAGAVPSSMDCLFNDMRLDDSSGHPDTTQYRGSDDDDEAFYRDDSNKQSLSGKKRRTNILSECEALRIAQTLLRDMTLAADLDEAAIAEVRPATAKLALLDVMGSISAAKWVQWYLQEGICSVFARWLNPLPDGGLPSLSVRSKVLELLQKMPINTDHLQGNQLGRRLIYMYKSNEELEENRVIIRSVVHQVLRPVFGLRWSYRNMRDCEPEVDAELLNPTNCGTANTTDERNTADTPIDESERLSIHEDRQDPAAATSRRARIPINAGYVFKILPRSTFEGSTQENRDTAGAGRRQRIFSSRSTRLPTQAIRVSISKSNP